MVLAERVGKKRSFWRGLLLTIATFGLYAIYWNYRAHNEAYRQFELSKEGRDEGVLWYVLGLVLAPFLVAYFWTMVSNVQYLRERMRLPRSLTPARFVTLFSVGLGSVLAALIFITALDATGNLSTDPSAEPTQMDILASELLVGGLVAFLATVPYAYHRLQKDLNELWSAYDRRIAELTSPAVAAPAAPPAAPPAAEARYLADLAPPPGPEEPRP